MIANLWESHSDHILSYLRQKVKDEELAKDLLQDTFRKALTHQKNLDDVENEKAWLFRIARNTLIDHSRKKKEEPLTNYDITVDTDTHSLKNSAGDIAQCLKELIEEYDEEEREILYTIFTESQSQKEISQYLGISYSTLKSRIQKARKEIAEAFKTRCCRLLYSNKGEIIGCRPVTVEANSTC